MRPSLPGLETMLMLRQTCVVLSAGHSSAALSLEVDTHSWLLFDDKSDIVLCMHSRAL